MTTMTVSDASSRLGELLDAAIRGEDVFIISATGRTAQLIAVNAVAKRRQFGSAKGRPTMADDFDEQLADFAEYR